jgi:acetyl-CoA carboxylase alpha subunit
MENFLAALQQSDEFRPEAMEALKLTAVHLKELELIGEVIPEPLGAHARTMNRPRRICAPRFSSISIS